MGGKEEKSIDGGEAGKKGGHDEGGTKATVFFPVFVSFRQRSVPRRCLFYSISKLVPNGAGRQKGFLPLPREKVLRQYIVGQTENSFCKRQHSAKKTT